MPEGGSMLQQLRALCCLWVTCSWLEFGNAQLLYKIIQTGPWSSYKVVQSVGSVVECSSYCKLDSSCTGFLFNSSVATCSLGNATQYLTGSMGLVTAYAVNSKIQADNAFSKMFFQVNAQTQVMATPSRLASATNCTQPPSYSPSVTNAYVGLVNGQVVVCGGIAYTSACRMLNATTNAWATFPSLPIANGYGRATQTPFGFWITGARQSASSSIVGSTWLFNTTSYSWVSSTNLPTPRNSHCIVQINGSHAFFAGGIDNTGAYQNDAWLYNWQSDKWTQVQNMSLARRWMSCISRKDSLGNDRVIIAGGGSTTTLVESLDLSSLTMKVLPASLPTATSNGVFVSDGSDLILVSFDSGKLMRFNDTDSTFYIIAGQTTTITGTSGAAVGIAINDNSLCNCTRN